ncbi:MAG: pilin [Patescibacteria group bacterium]|jgi:hypothetical protein
MKQFKLLIIFFFAIAAFLFSQPVKAALVSCDENAKDSNGNYMNAGQIELKWIHVQLPIPGVTANCVDDQGKSVAYIQDLGAYIAGMYKWFSGAIGILAAVMVMYGGIKWMVAAGNRSRVQDAKETVFTALIAVVIALGSYLLLFVINPKLVNLRPPALSTVKPVLQSFAMCPTFKICLSGTNKGQACVLDTACGAPANSGACDYAVDVGTDIEPTCGNEYTYREKATGSGTCRGSVCHDKDKNVTNDVCTLGTWKDSVFLPKAIGGTSWGCTSPVRQCESITDDNGSAADCSQFSIAGKGKCAWIDYPMLDPKSDGCYWFPVLECEQGYERVGCDICNNSEPFVITQCNLQRCSEGRLSKCISTQGEIVYSNDLTPDKKNCKSICCRKVGDTDLKCSAQ